MSTRQLNKLVIEWWIVNWLELLISFNLILAMVDFFTSQEALHDFVRICLVVELGIVFCLWCLAFLAVILSLTISLTISFIVALISPWVKLTTLIITIYKKVRQGDLHLGACDNGIPFSVSWLPSNALCGHLERAGGEKETHVLSKRR